MPSLSHAMIRRIHLQIKCGRFDSFLLVAGKAPETVGKRIGDEKDHRRDTDYALNSGIARTMNSSNSGTVNAMSPCAGL